MAGETKKDRDEVIGILADGLKDMARRGVPTEILDAHREQLHRLLDVYANRDAADDFKHALDEALK